MSFVIIKTVDSLGRIVLPKNMRDYYSISLNDKVKLQPTNKGILITRCCDNIDCKDLDDGVEKTIAICHK